MLSSFTIAHTGGRILFHKTFISSGSSLDPINSFISSSLLLNPNNSQQSIVLNTWKFAWKLDSSSGMLYVAVYDKMLTLDYVHDLIELVYSSFTQVYDPQNQGCFEPLFDTILTQVETAQFVSRQTKSKGPRKFEETKKFAQTLEGSKMTMAELEESRAQSSSSREQDTSRIEENIARFMKKKGIKGRHGPSSPPSNRKGDETSPIKTNSKKVRRVWGADGSALVQNDSNQQLDFSNEKESDETVGPATHLIGNSLGSRNKDGLYDAVEMDDDDESDQVDEEDDQIESKPSTLSLFSSYLSKLTQGKTLTKSDIEPLMEALKEKLVNKNVAADVATHVCTSIGSNLEGRTIGRFESIDKIVREETQLSIQRVLTPSSSTDLLFDILSHKSRTHSPYTIVFVGVNGVGKSTNLSKVCFWLLQNNLNVLIAACDTFRSGAVEQLRVHVRNLGAFNPNSKVELFDKGYGKDPAGIAQDAVKYATSNKFDVVLIDTAGRMQDNEPLMRALAKLVALNNPHKIIFVGEALVGNESIDQLTKFNAALQDFSGLAATHTRVIDAMILSKFDTIDDKVGACISMSFVTGKPVLFVGTGQTYTDLKRLNIKRVTRLLLE